MKYFSRTIAFKFNWNWNCSKFDKCIHLYNNHRIITYVPLCLFFSQYFLPNQTLWATDPKCFLIVLRFPEWHMNGIIKEPCFARIILLFLRLIHVCIFISNLVSVLSSQFYRMDTRNFIYPLVIWGTFNSFADYGDYGKSYCTFKYRLLCGYKSSGLG